MRSNKAFYALAKKYHPDFNPLETNAEQFKRIQKAYEVLSNPNARQAYDIENRFNEDLSADIKDNVYAQKLGRKNYYVTRQMKDFYHTQWTDYKKPDWYHPYNGHDVRSQYLYRKKNDDRAWFIPPYLDIALDWAEVNRIYIYFILFFIGDIYGLYKYYQDQKREKMQLEILQDSFSLDILDSMKEETEDNFVVYDASKTKNEGEKDEIDQDRDLQLRLALNDYINSRIEANSLEKQQKQSE